MMTADDSADIPQIAVWWFVGATFIFAAPVLFFPDAPLWVTIVTLALGLAAIVVGGIRLGKEITQRRARRDTPPAAPPSPRSQPPT